jgi:hypothetical protein
MVIKREKFQVFLTIQESSSLINPPEPNIDPVAKPPSLKIHKSTVFSISRFKIKSAGKMVLKILLVLMLSMV